MVAEEKQKEYGFWPDNIADELVKNWKVKKHVITTGTSMSGEPHIGNSNDVIRGDAIRLSLLDKKVPVELVWISDDLDPFRSVPADMPTELENYLGMPAAFIPDFWKCHKSFTEHFEEKFMEQLKASLTKPTVLLGVNMYKNGMYNDTIKIAMQKRKDIVKILNKYREHPLGEDWYPADIICEKCKKISTTKIISYDSKKAEAEYVCREDEIILHRKNPVAGCGNKGKVSVLNGGSKLTWRVEWAARWMFLGSTCEPFGKEHAAAGGSWDTGKEIAEKIFNYKPPYPIIYEHFLVNGEKMSKSKGNVITVTDMLKFMSPAHLRYWMFQGRLTIAKDIVLENIVPHVFDEFDRAEEAFFHPEKFEKREQVNLSRAYRLAIVDVPKKESAHIKFDLLQNLISIALDGNEAAFIKSEMQKKGIKISDSELKDKTRMVKNYIEKFKAKEKMEVKLSDDQKEALEDFIGRLKKLKTEDEIQKVVIEVANDHNMQIKEVYKMVYQILFSSDTGPRLGQYIMQAGKEEIIKKLQSVL